MFKKISSQCEIQGQVIKVETGQYARQADGAVLVSSGDNRVLVTAVSSRRESDLDFFPLTIEFQEKFYSVGRVPGGFLKREGRPSNEAILSARVIDRPIRPCFPEGYRYDTQIAATVLSFDGTFPVETLAGIGASTALHISDIPFGGPVGFLQVSLVNGEYKINLSSEESEKADMNLTVAGTSKGLLMVEGEAQFVSEKQALEGLKFAHKSMEEIFKMQEDLRKKTGSRAKREITIKKPEASFEKEVRNFVTADIVKALAIRDKTERYGTLDEIKKKASEKFVQEDENKKQNSDFLSSILGSIKSEEARKLVTEKSSRIDGRKSTDIRPIHCEAKVLPRVHGSAVFTRGETQVLGSVTLGTGDDEKMVDNLSGNFKKQFYLHYNFPPYCVGETGRFGGQSRREIGHGFLAERALKAALPSHESFPYTIRIVSDVFESNGSSSMGTVCSGTMALLDSGVPITDNIAGIAMGLIKEGGKVVVLSDILGDEDHIGDMDFKVAGSERGITALQMDIKIDSIDFQTMEQALNQALEGRIHILKEMEKVISKPEVEISEHAPRIEKMQIHPDKIREVIGSGGKVIKSISEQTGAKINIEDDGTLFVSSVSAQGVREAVKIIEGICEEAKVGNVYEGTVTGIKDFGAFVEILPNSSGLLHISQISNKRIDKVTDVLKEGDKIKVKVVNMSNGRISLSVKELEEKH